VVPIIVCFKFFLMDFRPLYLIGSTGIQNTWVFWVSRYIETFLTLVQKKH
jgi:hypothetical protein